VIQEVQRWTGGPGGQRGEAKEGQAIEARGPSGARSLTATPDCGADDTLLPAHLAPRIGIDLDQAPEGEAGTVGGPPISYRYATVRLRLSDGYEECEIAFAFSAYGTIPPRGNPGRNESVLSSPSR
jgi:hypothetical protein